MIFASLVKRVNGKAVLPKIRELQLDTASLRSEWLVFLTKTEGDEIDGNVKLAYQIASGVCGAEIQQDEVFFADLVAILTLFPSHYFIPRFGNNIFSVTGQ